MGSSKLLQITSHQADDQTEVLLRQAFESIEPKLKPPLALSIPKTPEEYEQLNMALIYGILIEAHFAKTRFKYLHGIVTDGYSCFLSLAIKVVNEFYTKIVGSAKVQLIWIGKEMIDVNGVGVEGLWASLLRQIIGGDFGEENLWLCYELLSALLEKWDLLVKEESSILSSALFVYLRVLTDHCGLSSGNVKLEVLMQMEIDFCIRLLREKFHMCLKIGRDLVRLLQDLVHVPGIREIWKDLLLNPIVFRTPGFSDISQLYKARTSSRYFLLRVTPEMKAQLRFLLTHVKFGNQRRYQVWFARKFLFVPERETLISDIVRFICCVHHPTNEIIQSEVIPRWAVIGWLLKSCQKHYVEANVKLALFYDWLFFDERVDNIMNIEPAMLLMVHSIPTYIDITHNLLEFLFLLVENYDSERSSAIRQGVSSALRTILKKGVIHSLDILTASDSLSPHFKERLKMLLKADDPAEPQPAITPIQIMPPLCSPTPHRMETKILSSKRQENTKCV